MIDGFEEGESFAFGPEIVMVFGWCLASKGASSLAGYWMVSMRQDVPSALDLENSNVTLH